MTYLILYKGLCGFLCIAPAWICGDRSPQSLLIEGCVGILKPRSSFFCPKPQDVARWSVTSWLQKLGRFEVTELYTWLLENGMGQSSCCQSSCCLPIQTSDLTHPEFVSTVSLSVRMVESRVKSYFKKYATERCGMIAACVLVVHFSSLSGSYKSLPFGCLLQHFIAMSLRHVCLDWWGATHSFLVLVMPRDVDTSPWQMMSCVQPEKSKWALAVRIDQCPFWTRYKTLKRFRQWRLPESIIWRRPMSVQCWHSNS